MPRQVSLKEIAEKNPNFDSEKLEELRKFRERLSEYRTNHKRYKGASPVTSKRAQLIDDKANDSRLVKLQRNR
ncbi:MAG TPA: hypothetical protein VFB79_22545 [Candidatus Angelobacter sp.]|nr:hypothetical protein [Candidatus Angelobacter sp.]